MKLNFNKLKPTGIVQKLSLLVAFLVIGITSQTYAQLRIGDAGIKFDESKFDSRYPQMREWVKAGVEGGIPLRSTVVVKKTISATNSSGINSAIDDVARQGGGILMLNNGRYTVNSSVKMKSNVRVVGQSKEGVRLIVTMGNGDGVSFRRIENSGIENLTIEGGFGVPNDFEMTEAKKSFFSVSVKIDGSAKSCWVDNCNILNSGRHPLIVSGNYNTIRDCFISRCWNKSSGYQGYVHIRGNHNLVTTTECVYLRHFSMQDSPSEYNVIYGNYTQQEINFHNDDNGNNLVEKNTIRLHKGLRNIWTAMMGPWSRQHNVSRNDNYLFNNDCIEHNRNNLRPFSDKSKVYVGPNNHQDSTPESIRSSEFAYDSNNRVPTGGTFYPIILDGNAPAPTPTAPPVVVTPTPAPVNVAPVVNITKPNNNQIFEAGDTIAVDVTATDDTGIANVELFLNGKSIRQEKSAPYNWAHTSTLDPELKNMPAGTYTIKIVATDTNEATTEKSISVKVESPAPTPIPPLVVTPPTPTPTPSNIAPVVSITKPNNNQIFEAGDTIAVDVTATDDTGIANVELFLNGKSIRQEKSAPYNWAHTSTLDPELKSMTAGTYTLKAVATDTNGATTEKSISVKVEGPAPTPPVVVTPPVVGPTLAPNNGSIVVTISKPNNNQVFKVGETVAVDVTTNNNSDVDKVEVYLDGELIRQESYAPYNWGHLSTLDPELKNMKPGIYSITAIVTDKNGGTSKTSISVNVGNVDAESTNSSLSFALPSSRSFNVNETVLVDVRSSISVRNVRLYLNDKFIRQENVSPYLWGRNDNDLKNLNAGTYNLRAVSQNNDGSTSEAQISITIGSRGAKSIENNPFITLYPNPATTNSSVTVDGATIGKTISVYNGLGQVVKQVIATSITQEITLDGLPSGLYFVNSNNEAVLKLIIK